MTDPDHDPVAGAAHPAPQVVSIPESSQVAATAPEHERRVLAGGGSQRLVSRLVPRTPRRPGAHSEISHPTADEATLWTVADVAAYLCASRSWVYHRAENGELPCLRVGGLLRFDPAAIKAFVRGERHVETHVLASRRLDGR
jgi:excisionase family DNA binding protein